MYTIITNKEEVFQDFPNIENDWIMNIKKYIKPDLNEEKMEFFYSYGFFLPKVEDREAFYEDMFNKCSNMMFDQRLDFELSKIRVNLTINSGNFYMSDRLPNGHIPLVIKNIVTEITKVKMLVESEYHGNDSIIESIPEIDSNIVSFQIIRDAVSNEYSESKRFDIDGILDKISKTGIDSLSDDERDFLDKKSKDL